MSLNQAAAQTNTDAAAKPVSTEEKLYGETTGDAATATKEDTKQIESKTEEPAKEAPAKEELASADKPFALKLPEGSLLKDADVEKIVSSAKEQGLSEKQAQFILDEKNSTLANFVQEQKEILKQQTQVEWVKQVRADKELGGENMNKNLELARRVVTRFGTETFKKALDESGFGNHPELLRVFSRIGSVLGDDQFVTGQTTPTKKRSAEEIFYGGTSKKG